MFELLKVAIRGAGLVFGAFFVVMLLLRGCIAIVDAQEVDPRDPRPVYEGFGVYGKPFIDNRMLYPDDPIIVIIERGSDDIDTFVGGTGCSTSDIRFYMYVIKRLELRTDTSPGFWDSTIVMYEDLLEECDP